MLIIHPTRSLVKKLHVTLQDVDLRPAFLDEWYCNNFKFSKIDFVIFVNPETYLPLVLRATPYRDLVVRFSIELSAYLKKIGYSALASSEDSKATFAKAQDRVTLGIMTQFIKDLQAEDDPGRIRPENAWAMTARLGATLVGGPKYKTPLERLAERARLPVAPNINPFQH